MASVSNCVAFLEACYNMSNFLYFYVCFMKIKYIYKNKKSKRYKTKKEFEIEKNNIVESLNFKIDKKKSMNRMKMNTSVRTLWQAEKTAGIREAT